MASFSDWLNKQRADLTAALTNAYNNRNAGNNLASAWNAMYSDLNIRPLLPTATKFYGGSPSGTEAEINTMQNWLQANPTEAGYLNLAAETAPTNNSALKSVGGGGNVGSEKRRWKGQPVYTFGNGILVGRNEKLVAAIGTEGGTDLDGFGADTLNYFDGVKFSKGTNVAGTTVFAGDMVISGSLQGSGGVIIIDDVIQLETGVSNPAGIGLDSTGKILLRHRGEGFLDLIAEDEKIRKKAIDATRDWIGNQNRNASKYGSSVIPNSTFQLKQTSGSLEAGTYAERPAGVINIGTASNGISYPSDGIIQFNGNGKGILFASVPLSAAKYSIRIRYAGAVAETIDDGSASEGIFLAVHETTDATLGDKQYVYKTGAGADPSVTVESGVTPHATNVTIKYLNQDGSTPPDGSSIPASSGTWAQSVFTYTPSTTATHGSLAIYAKNYNANLYIDYVVMTPISTDAAGARLEAEAFTSAVNEQLIKESGSLITNASMALAGSTGNGPAGYRGRGTGIALATQTNGSTGDKSVKITGSGGARTLITPTFGMDTADKYSIGVSAKAVSGSVNVKIKVAYTNENLPTGKVTIASNAGSNSDVYTTNVTETSYLEIDPGNGEGGADATDWNVGTSYENILVTWSAVSAQKTGAIIIEASGDFEVDYVLVKEQVVSYSLADSRAATRKQEAIDSSVQYSQAITLNMTQEAGSQMPNAAFATYQVSGTAQRPTGYWGTRGTNYVKRLLKTSPNNPASTDTETVLDVGQNGDALEFKNTSTDESYGILCPAISLGIPIGTNGGGDAINSTTPSNNGRYNIILKVRSSAEEPISIQIKAHEFFGSLSPSKSHCYEATLYNTGGSGAGVESGVSSAIQSFVTTGGASATGALQDIKLINITSGDTQVGLSGADLITEIIPVDNSETQGDTDNDAANYATWYDIGGTYTANSRTRAVCFEIVINNDVDNDNNLAHPYVDYIFFGPQSFDADFADSLASARKQEAITSAVATMDPKVAAAKELANELAASANSAAMTLVDNVNKSIAAEEGSILYNAGFSFAELQSKSVSTSFTGSGLNDATFTTDEGFEKGAYKVEILGTDSGLDYYRWYKDGSLQNSGEKRYCTTKDTPLGPGAPSVRFGAVTGHTPGEFWTSTMVTNKRPVGYRLAGPAHYNSGSATGANNNLQYHTEPSTGNASIAIHENYASGVNTGESAISLLTPPIKVPSDGQITSYQIAVKIKGIKTSDDVSVDLRVHELYSYISDSYVTLCANETGATTLNHTNGQTYTAPANKGHTSGANGTTENDVFVFTPHSKDLTIDLGKKNACSAGTFNNQTDCENDGKTWTNSNIVTPAGTVQDVTVITLSDASDTTTEDETVNHAAFKVIGGGVDIRTDTKMFAIEVVCTGIDTSADGGYIIDYIHVIPSTIGAAAATTIANDRADVIAASKITTLKGGYAGTLQSLKTDIDNVSSTVEAEDPSKSLIPFSTFAISWAAGGSNYARNWVATSSSQNKIKVYDQGNDSIGTYIMPFDTTSDENYGMLSKMVEQPAAQATTFNATAGTKRIGSYNIAIRVRGSTASRDYSVKCVAHEAREAIASGKTHIISSAVNGASQTPDTETRASLQQYTTGASIDLQTVDISLGSPTPSTETSVTTNHQNWRIILASYTPNEAATGVSFEWQFNADKNNDNAVQTLYVDSVYMDMATTDETIVQSLANAAESQAAATAQSYTNTQKTAIEGDRKNLIESIANESDSLVPNSTFSAKKTLAGPSSDRPTGYALYRYPHVSNAGTGHGTSNDRKRFLKYHSSSSATNQVIQLQESSHESTTSMSLLTPVIMAQAKAYNVAIKVKSSDASDNDVKCYIRSHQFFGAFDSATYTSVAAGTAGNDYTINSTSYDHTAALLASNAAHVEAQTLTFNPSHFDVTVKGAEGLSPTPAGTSTSANVVILDDNSDVTLLDNKTIGTSAYNTIAGSIKVHPDATVISFEFHFTNIDANDGPLIDTIVVQPHDDNEVDFADAVVETRLTTLVETLEAAEEEDEELVNVIANPMGKEFFEGPDGNACPKAWRYVSSNNVHGLGYRIGGTMVKKPQNVRKMSIAKYNERGISSGDDYRTGGIVSKPFKITSEDYELNLKFKLAGGAPANYANVFIMIMEYDTIAKPSWIHPNDQDKYDTNLVLRGKSVGTAVAATRKVNLLGTALTNTDDFDDFRLTAGANAAVLDDGSASNKWYLDGTGQGTDKYYRPADQNSHVITCAYEPTSTAKWASICILLGDNDPFYLVFDHLNVMADQAKGFSKVITRKGTGFGNHFKGNDSDWSSRGTSITNQGNSITTNAGYQDNLVTRLSDLQGQKSDDTKGQLGVFSNGRMTAKENTASFVKTNTSVTLKPAGWETWGQSSNKIFYASGSNNKIAEMKDVRCGMICPAFEITEDKYQFKIRYKVNEAYQNWIASEQTTYGTEELQLIAYYTTDDGIDGEYVLASGATTTIAANDQHTTNTTFRRLAANSSGNTAANTWSTRTFTWDPPNTARFCSIMIYKYDATVDLQVDWITGYADTRGVLAADFTKTASFSGLDADTIFPAGLRNSAVDATHVGLGNVTNKSASQLASDSNFTGNFGSLSAVNTNTTGRTTNATNIGTNVTNLSNVGTRMSAIKSRKKRAGKSKMGVFDNGRMILTEDIGTFSITNTTEELKPAGWEETYYSTSQISYKDSNHKQMKIGTSRSIALSPAFEIKEDKYRFRIRVGSNTGSWSFHNSQVTMANYNSNTHNVQLLAFYTTDTDLSGDYVSGGFTNSSNRPEDTHSTNVTVVSLACTSTSDIASNGSSYSLRQFTWDPPSDAEFASIGIYKYASTGELYVDWITGSPDTRSLRPTATSLNINSLVGFSPSTLASNSAFTNSFRGSSFMPTFSQVAGTTSSGATVDIDEIGGFNTTNRLVRTKTNTVRGVSTKQMVVSPIYADDSDIRVPSGITVGGISNSPNNGQVRIEQGYNSVSAGIRLYAEEGGDEYWNIWHDNNENLKFTYYEYSNTTAYTRAYIAHDTNVSNLTFTGQHRNVAKDTSLHDESSIGLIVVSTGVYNSLNGKDTANKPQINEALPVLELSSKRNEKTVWGVISNTVDDVTVLENELYDPTADNPEDTKSSVKVRKFGVGSFVSAYLMDDGDPERLIVNSLGEGAIWVCNINGNLENGDYITACEVPGYGMLQDDDLLHNYTVAKITQDCDFELNNPNYDCVEFEHEGQTYRKAFVGCTYHCG